MAFLAILCTIFLVLNVQLIASDDPEPPYGTNWTLPYFDVAADPRITLISQEKCVVQLEFDEEVKDFRVGTFPIKDVPTLVGGSDFFEIRAEHVLQAVAPIDYEKLEEGNKTVRFKVQAGDESVEFVFNIVNINDNPMKIVVNNDFCYVEESVNDLNTSCTYTIKDADGIDKTLIITEISTDYNEYFNLEWHEDFIGKQSAEATLHTKHELDFEKNQIFAFNWTVKDAVFEDTSVIMVKVEDIPDTPPRWVSIFTFQQFVEESPQNFTVSATDGDYVINDEITFECPLEEMSEQLRDKLTCDIDVERNTGIINIKPLDRDVENINTLFFKIQACEVNGPKQCAPPQDIILIIDDINDNEPKITLSTNKLTIDENKFTNLNELIEITIEDKDFGVNGQYNVTLSSNIHDPDIDVNSIFQIIPNNGYQKTSFQLAIIEASILDYDRTPDLRNFKLTLTAQELDENKDPQTADIEIELINWNDETLEFKEPKYEVEIEETFGRCKATELKINNLYATDLDVTDTVSYELVGVNINTILEVSGENEKLVLKSIHSEEENCDIQLFDYENQSVISFQIQASDNFPNSTIIHKTYTEVTITLSDVNDEPPHIEVNPSSIELEENQEDGVNIITTITGTDPDTQSRLEFGIDWEKSYATKCGQRKEIFDTYRGCFRIETNGSNAELFIVDKEPNRYNTPDYEEFDTINLNLFVMDIAQTIEGVSNRAHILIINVVDLNDNAPEFDKDTITSPKKVKENSEKDTPIAVVIAKDADVGTQLKYFIKSRNGTEDFDRLVIIDDNGKISVDTDKGIDAENNGNGFIYELNYDVCAQDGTFATCEEIYIVVDDVNDEKPTFIEEPKDITELKENSDIGQLVYAVKAEDRDRDKPNNVITYIMSSTPQNNFIGIDSETGKITVINEGLDREQEPIYEVTVTILDNPVNLHEQLSNVAKFKIKLKDQNDNCPVFENDDEIVVSENTDADNEIGKFRVTDEDEPGNRNSDIEMRLEDVYSEGNGNRILKKEDFQLTFAQTNQGNKAMATGTIKTKKSLRNFYGTHKLLIQAKDKGPEWEGPECSHTVLKNVTLLIEKYSFAGPTFIFPADKPIYLKHDQDLNTILKDQGGNDIRKIEAYDTDDKDKFNIKFGISDKNEGSKYFTIIKKGKTQGELQLIARPNENRRYEIEIIATNDAQRPQSTRKTVKIGFFDQDSEPVFNANEINLKFKEDEEGVGKPQNTSQARFEGPEGSELPIYYLIHQNMHFAFECDKFTGEIQLITPLYLENTTDNYLILQASSTSQAIGQPDLRSLLKINIELIDVNNHAPEFDQEEYVYGITKGPEKTPHVINGADLDPLDTLSYYMKKGSYQANGSGLSTELTFDIKADENRRCQITPTFDVNADMDGYFSFVLTVDDSKYTAEANVKVFIISELHLTAIYFENILSEVQNSIGEIQKILSEVLEYTCVIHKIEKAIEGGVNVDHKTKVLTYCIDPKRNIAIHNDTFKT